MENIVKLALKPNEVNLKNTINVSDMPNYIPSPDYTTMFVIGFIIMIIDLILLIILSILILKNKIKNKKIIIFWFISFILFVILSIKSYMFIF